MQGNYIGTERTGTLARSNEERGIAISQATNANVLNNLISGNGTSFGSGGIVLQWGTTGSVIQGNLIGTNAAGTGSIPNTGNGITINGGINAAVNNNAIGATGPGQGNVIANNTNIGILIEGAAFGAVGNFISGNRIFANVGNGISLTLGGNNEKIAPSISLANTETISGTCEAGDVVELFYDSPQTGTTNQGRTYIGTAVVSGTTWSLNGSFNLGERVTATAISSANNTSSFSTALIVEAAPLPFITTWITTNGQITIPTTGAGYNYEITWINLTNAGVGDGSVGEVTGNYTISGLENGSRYEIRILGDFPRIFINNGTERAKLRTIEKWGEIQWSSMQGAFWGCSNLQITASDAPNLTNVTSFREMFRACTSMTGNVSMNTWNTSNVTSMFGSFWSAFSFNQDLNNWNVSNVTDMFIMFQEATAFNGNIDNWNVGNVTNMVAMFANASAFNRNIGGWNVANVSSMNNLFSDAISFNQDIGGWNVGSVTDMAGMFYNASSFNQNLNNWNVANVNKMGGPLTGTVSDRGMFENALVFNGDITNWNVGNVTSAGKMFSGASAFNQDISTWNVSSFLSMEGMFREATSFDQNLGNWNVSNVTNMEAMLNAMGMSKPNYDSTLIAWSALTLQNNVSLGAEGRTYCVASEARQSIIDTYNWTIIGDVLQCPLPQTITFSAIDPKVYGDPNFPILATSSAGLPVTLFSSDEAILSLVGNEASILGAGAVTISATQAGNEDFLPADTAFQLIDIAQRSLEITANDQEKFFGQADPVLTYEISAGSLVFDDSFTGALGRESGENLGEYAINIGTLSAGDNYQISFIPAILRINLLQVNESDSLALVAIYNASSGTTWLNNTNWLENPVSGWFGVSLMNDRVISLQLSGNLLAGEIPSEINDLDSLITLDFSNNALIAMPNLSGLSKLESLIVSNNQLQFGSLEPNMGLFGSSADFIPQSNLGVAENRVIVSRAPFSLSFEVSGEQNQYQWYKDSDPIAGANQNQFQINPAQVDLQGIYYLEVSNPIVTDLTLLSEEITITYESYNLSGKILGNEGQEVNEGLIRLLEI